MKIQATQVMAREIAKAAKAKGLEYKVKQVMLTDREYGWYVGDIYDAEDYGDYSDTTNKYRAIRIEYPDNYYACPRYISTMELHHLFSKGDTLTEYMAKVLDEIEI